MIEAQPCIQDEFLPHHMDDQAPPGGEHGVETITCQEDSYRPGEQLEQALADHHLGNVANYQRRQQIAAHHEQHAGSPQDDLFAIGEN